MSRPVLQGLTRQLNRMAKVYLEAEIKAMEDPAGSFMQILKLQKSEARTQRRRVPRRTKPRRGRVKNAAVRARR